MQGYLGDPEASQEALQDAWLKTGDLGFFDDGELFVTGRSKDLIILRGRNHEPQVIEEAVQHVEGVRRGCTAAVSTLQEGDATERLMLFIETPRKGQTPDPESLTERCAKAVRERVGLTVDQIVILSPGTLPRTSSGKIRRAETLARHQSGTLTAPDPVSWWRLTRHLIHSAGALRRSRSS